MSNINRLLDWLKTGAKIDLYTGLTKLSGKCPNYYKSPNPIQVLHFKVLTFVRHPKGTVHHTGNQYLVASLNNENFSEPNPSNFALVDTMESRAYGDMINKLDMNRCGHFSA